MGDALRVHCLVGLLLLAQAAPQACDPRSPVADPAEGEIVTAADGTRFTIQTFATGLEIPWSLAFAPDGRLFVTERPGRVRIVVGGRVLPEPALILDDVLHQGEGGLMGLAFDPRFATTRFVYLMYSARSGSGGVNRIVRYREVANTLGEPAVLLDGIPFASIHNGGRLQFGPDGHLYAATGDAAVPPLAQDLASLAGKILRIAIDGSSPRDNPFGSPVWSWGHRNPQGIAWHPSTGDLWSTEHGATGNDELNRIDAGRNYGWPVIEGAVTRPDMEAPVRFYTPAIAPSGAAFYTGGAFPTFRNDLFFATLRGGHLRRVRIDPANPRQITSDERLLDGRFGRLRDVVVGPEGFLYVATNNRDGRGTPAADDDRILRLVPAR